MKIKNICLVIIAASLAIQCVLPHLFALDAGERIGVDLWRFNDLENHKVIYRTSGGQIAITDAPTKPQAE